METPISTCGWETAWKTKGARSRFRGFTVSRHWLWRRMVWPKANDGSDGPMKEKQEQQEQQE